MKLRITLFFMFVTVISYSQLLKETNVLFTNFKAFSKVDSKLQSGELLKEGEANTKIEISNIGIRTFIAFESTVLKSPEQVFIVSNIVKAIEQDKLICDVETYNGQDPDKKTVRFILVYVDDTLKQFIFPVNDYAIQFF